MKIRRIIALCACVCMALASCNSRNNTESPATGTPTDSGPGGQVSITMRPDAVQDPAGIVVFFVGEEPVYNSEFRYHMVTKINAYASSDEARGSGFDPSIALSEQAYPDSDMTFEDVFTENVMDELQYSIAMYLEAKATGFELSQELRASIDAFFAQFDEYISQAGVTDEEAFAGRYGMKMSRAQVYSIMERSMLGEAYSQYINGEIVHSDKEIEDFYEEHKDIVFIPDVNAVSLRLIHFSAMQPALDVKEKYESGDMTEESFIELVALYSVDEGEIESGGLVTDLMPERYIETQFDEVEKWVFDRERKTGDCTVLSTTAGFELAFFVEKGEPVWKTWTRQTMKNVAIQEIIDKYEITYQ